MQKLGLGETLRVGAWRLIPVELTAIEPSPMNGWSGVYATKKPYAILLVDGGGARRALDIEGRDVPLSRLLEQAPELADILTDPRIAGTSHDDSASNG